MTFRMGKDSNKNDNIIVGGQPSEEIKGDGVDNNNNNNSNNNNNAIKIKI